MSKNLIPKVIHYCWFGRSELPDSVKRSIDSWKRICPGYAIIQWDESNYDYNKINYVADAYKRKKYAFVSDYARLDIIYNNGGIYLDTDVELIKSLDTLLENRAFAGIENTGINLGLGFGAQKGVPELKDMMDRYREVSFLNKDGSSNLTPMPVYTTEYFIKKGYKMRNRNRIQRIGSFTIYPAEYFNPKNMMTDVIDLKDNTYSIHHYDASWHGGDEQKELRRQRWLFKKNIWLWRVYNGIKTLRKEGIYPLINKIQRMRIDK
ncbi:hypothetical protein IMSAGC019_02656 [Lachnospiraceae bacterium]|nr:hypothetical protein IMSAGC019_02656 [Lachnospiraceae bacterium]